MTLFRYLLVSAATYAIDLGAYVILVALGVGPVVANLLGKIPAGIFAFTTHRAFTFRIADPGGIRHEAARYVALLCANAPISSAILWGLLRVIPDPTLAKIAADVLTVCATFLLTRHFVFGRAGAAGRVAERER